VEGGGEKNTKKICCYDGFSYGELIVYFFVENKISGRSKTITKMKDTNIAQHVDYPEST
jgi:hypothetical protein